MKKLHDYYFKRAKEEHYLARSVYKLDEINRRYRILRKGSSVLDVGCAPGSWSQYMLKKIGPGRVMGIDIKKSVTVSDPRFSYLQKNLFNIDREFFQENADSFDVITSDAAPKTTGQKFTDHQNSLSIVRRVFEISNSVLKDGGTVVAKVFQGEDLKEFVDSVRERFERIDLCKPKSSRKESSELFIIAQRKKKPLT
jgi:23S rRNA (uridine2552-2'-O)-methyltransferase